MAARLSALPLRLRLTLVFVAAMAVVLTAIGVFLYHQTRANLDTAINQALRARVHALGTTVEADTDPASWLAQDPLFEVTDAAGKTIVASPSAQRQLRLTAAERLAALDRGVLVNRGEELRLRAERAGPNRIVVVASTLRQQERALNGLTTALLIAGPLALLLAALAAYLLATRAFASIDAMRARADEISHASPVGRLPLERAPQEIRVLGETLNAMLERIGASAEHERRFVADASHELRTPLAVLQTELEIAQRDTATVDELQLAISSALDETRRLTLLTDSLLTLARADRQGATPQAALLSPLSLAKHVAAEFEPVAAEQGRTIVVTGHDAVLHGDAVYLEQAIGNLVRNALLHGDGSVTIDVGEVSGRVEFRVRDQGRGFPSGFVERAFDRFSRAPDAPRASGSGLGLSIVAAIADAHDGEVRIEPVAVGAEVVLSLPAEPSLSRLPAAPTAM